jgi:protein SCO1
MWRTSLACTALAATALFCAASLTEGFDVWTAEGARRLRVANAPVAVPHAMLVGDQLNGLSLQEVLAQPGRVTIASFIYTRCTSVCLTLGSNLQQLQAVLGSDIKLLSISFDPAHDDAEQLRRHAALWRADARYWRMASVPDAAQLQRLLEAWQVVVIADGRGGWEHNAALLVIDQRGRLVRIFDDNDVAGALDFARALQRAGSVT